MKQNFMRFASLIAMVLIGFSACQNKKQDIDIQEGGAYGYASFTIALPSNNTLKAEGVDQIGHGQDYIGTKAENKVSAVLIALYDGEVCAERFDLNITADGTNAFTGSDLADNPAKPVSKELFTTKAKKMVRKDYKVVVFLNPTAEIKGRIAKGRALADLTAVASVNMGELVSEKEGIMMSNAKGIVTLNEAQFKKTAKEAEGAPLALNVDRAIAKVFVNPNLPETNPQTGVLAGATLTLKGWNLDVTNKKLFFIREMGMKITDAASSTTAPEEVGTERINSYAKDPNMAWTSAQEKDDKEFVYLNNLELNGGTLWAPGYDDDKGHYVAENTMDADAQWRRASTSVVFAIKIQPNGIGENDAYVTFKNKPYTIAKFTEKINSYNALDENIKGDDVKADAELGMPSGFSAAVKAIGVEDLKAKIAEGKPAFSEQEIRFYPNQINHYAMPIRHFTDTQSGKIMGYGRFGVVRNNIYKLSVSSIKNFGEPTVPVVPDEEDEKEKDFFSVEVTVNPWLVRESSYDL